MKEIYFLEVNITCIVVLCIIRNQYSNTAEKFSAQNIILRKLINVAIILCFSDALAGIFIGKMFPGARIITELSNMIFYEALTVVSYLWTIYINIRLKFITSSDYKKRIIGAIPLILFTLIAITNPFTHILYMIDENNMYYRTSGTAIHWAVTWLYLVIPTVQTLITIINEKNKYKRQEYMPLLFFVIPPFIASMTQMFAYGVTSSQVGITVSILIIFLNTQKSKIVSDSLTGINNRHGYEMYIQNQLPYNTNTDIYLIMIDLNGFKKINDTFGHLVGDKALQDLADALKLACRNVEYKLFLCRFGGDEFVVIMHDCEQCDVDSLIFRIKYEIDQKNKSNTHLYKLNISLGVSCMKCTRLEDTDKLMEIADKLMYKNKRIS